MASRSLDDLHPKVRALTVQWINTCFLTGIDVLVYCTYRSPEEQNELYAIGRSKPGKIGTNARAGDSYHQYRVALDFVPMVGGKPTWRDASLYSKAGRIAEELGFEWAGRWTGKLRETAHLQFTGGLTLAQFKSGRMIA